MMNALETPHQAEIAQGRRTHQDCAAHNVELLGSILQRWLSHEGIDNHIQVGDAEEERSSRHREIALA